MLHDRRATSKPHFLRQPSSVREDGCLPYRAAGEAQGQVCSKWIDKIFGDWSSKEILWRIVILPVCLLSLPSSHPTLAGGWGRMREGKLLNTSDNYLLVPRLE